MQVFSILSTIFSFNYLLKGANAAFSTNTTPSLVLSSGSSSQSCLFRTVPASSSLFSSPVMMNRKKNQPLSKPLTQAQLVHKMTSNDDDEEVKTEVVESKPTSEEKGTGGTSNSSNNGFLTALFLAPPLIAKFGIVLLVKIVTDLVVFPLLFMYRFCQTVKAKVAGFVQTDDFKGDKINGAT